MTCDEITEYLVDYLYGELDAGTRAAFDAHAAGCAGCRERIAGLGAARAEARAALRLLDEDAPAGARARVLEAARQAASAGVSGRGADERGEAGGGLRAWFGRPWLFPAFGVAAAFALFVFAQRIITNPDRVVPRATVESETISAPAASPSPKDDEREARRDGDEGGRAAPRPVPRPRKVSAASEERKAKAIAPDDVLGQASAGAPEAARAPGGAGLGAVLERGANGKGADLAGGVAEGTISGARERSFAQPPPAVAVPASPPASPRTADSAVKKESSSRPAQPPAAPSRPEPAREAEETAEAGRAAPSEPAKAGAASLSAPSVTEWLRRLDRAIAEERLGDAADLLRELLDHFPGHADAPKWRKRLTEIEARLRAR